MSFSKLWDENKNKIFAGIFIAVFSGFLIILIPIQKLAITLRLYCFYVLLTTIQHWLFSIILVLIIAFRNIFVSKVQKIIPGFIKGKNFYYCLSIKMKKYLNGAFLIFWFILGSTFFGLAYDIIFPSFSENKIVFAGIYSMDQGGNLQTTSITKSLSDSMYIEAQKCAANFPSFKENIFQLTRLNIPDFLIPILNVDGFRNFIKWRSKSSTLIYAFHDCANQNLRFFFEGEALYGNVALGQKSKLLFNHFSNKKFNFQESVGLAADYFITLTGQSVIDALAKMDEIKLSFDILVKAQKNMEEIFYVLRQKNMSGIDSLASYYRAAFTGQKAILLEAAGDPTGAINNWIDAIKLQPFYPYDNYEEYKLENIEYYGRDLAEQMKVWDKIDDENIKDKQHILDNLEKDLDEAHADWEYFPPVFEQLLIVLEKNIENKNLVEQTQKRYQEILNKFPKNPIAWLYWGDILKFSPLGTEMFNKVYVKRIPRVRNIYLKALQLDPNFPITYSKIAFTYNCEGFSEAGHKQKKKMDIAIKKGFKYFWSATEMFIRQEGNRNKKKDIKK